MIAGQVVGVALHQAPFRKSTLDHLGVKSDNRLVEEEPTFLKDLTVEKVTEF